MIVPIDNIRSFRFNCCFLARVAIDKNDIYQVNALQNRGQTFLLTDFYQIETISPFVDSSIFRYACFFTGDTKNSLVVDSILSPKNSDRAKANRHREK